MLSRALWLVVALLVVSLAVSFGPDWAASGWPGGVLR